VFVGVGKFEQDVGGVKIDPVGLDLVAVGLHFVAAEVHLLGWMIDLLAVPALFAYLSAFEVAFVAFQLHQPCLLLILLGFCRFCT
jgi:hypothetical protein